MSSPFFDPGLRDLVIGLLPGEVVIADREIADEIRSRDFVAESRFGSDPSHGGPRTYLSGERAQARAERLEGATTPPVLTFEEFPARLPPGTQRAYVAAATGELSRAEAIQSSGAGLEVLSLKNDAHPLLRIPRGFEAPLRLWSETKPDDPIQDLVIVGVPRSGSYLLAEYLNMQGLGLAEEHLKEDVARVADRPRDDFDFEHWYSSLRRGGHQSGYFATKLMSHYWRQLDERLSNDSRARFARFLQNSVVVILNRRDRVQQAISSYISIETRVYRLRSERAKDDYQPEEVAYDSERIANRLAWTNGEYRSLSQLLAGYGISAVEVFYEDLVEDPAREIRKVTGAAAVVFSELRPPKRNRKMRTDVSLEFAERFRKARPDLVAESGLGAPVLGARQG